MIQTLKRPLIAVAAVALVGALASTAVAAPGHGRFGARSAAAGGFGGFSGGFAGLGGSGFGFGGGFGGPGLGGRGFGGGDGQGEDGGSFGSGQGQGNGQLGGGGPQGGGAGILGADVLTPAASFLGITVSALASDLNGGKTLAQEAVAKGKTASALISAIVAAETTVLDNEKAAGWITSTQETSLIGDLTTQITDLVNNGPPVPQTTKQTPLQVAANYLGMSVSDLQTALKSGKSLADEATAQGKSVDGLVSALTAQAKSSLDAEVTAGTITVAQEGTILAKITTQITNLVNTAKGSNSVQQQITRMQSLFKHA